MRSIRALFRLVFTQACRNSFKLAVALHRLRLARLDKRVLIAQHIALLTPASVIFTNLSIKYI